MAEDGKPAESGEMPASFVQGASVQGTSAPPRAKPVIEGVAIDATNKTEETPPADEGPENETPRGSVPPEAPPARRRTDLWPIAASIVIGAALAVGGAFGLHDLDRTPPALAPVAERVTRLEAELDRLKAQPGAAASQDRRITVLEQDVAQTKIALAKIDAAEQRLRTQFAAAKASVATSSAPVSARSNATFAPMLAPLAERQDKLEHNLSALDQRVAALAAQVANEIGGLQARKTGAVQAALVQAKANTLAIVAADLRRKVETGEAFADDLSALAAQGIDHAQLTPLTAFAASGAPTQAMLAIQFGAVTPAILSVKPEPRAQGVLGRLAADAAHLIRIERIGDTRGNDLAAQVARLGAALSAGRLDEALRDWQALPTAAQEKSKDFGTSLRQRVAASAAAKAIEAEALAELAKTKP